MTDRKLTNLAASVRQRLLNRAKAEGRAFQEVAALYAMERFLFRLGRSPHADRFVLMGGLMTLTWVGEHARVTRDIDLLGRGVNSVAAVAARMRDILAVETDDGVLFDAATVEASEITAEAAYVGVRSILADRQGPRCSNPWLDDQSDDTAGWSRQLIESSPNSRLHVSPCVILPHGGHRRPEIAHHRGGWVYE